MKDAIGAALAAANVMMRVAARSVVEVEDVVTTPQLRILMLISGSGPQKHRLCRSRAERASVQCDAAVRKARSGRAHHALPDPSDRRYVQLELTTRGTALVDHVLRERRAAMAEVFARMSADEQANVAAAFESFAVAAGSEPTHDGRFAFALQP